MNKRQISGLERARHHAIYNGGLCLSNAYNRAKDELLWKCKNNHEWQRDYDKTISRGIWCSICESNEKRQKECDTWYQECLKLATNKDGVCLSKYYIDANTVMEWKCNKDGYIWSTSFNSLRNGSTWCPKCSGKARHTIEECNELAKQNNGKCLSTEYKNNEDYLQWECEYNHQWSTSYGHIYQGRWCPVCSGRQRKILEDAKKVAEKKEGECLSTEYINARTPMMWRCINNHMWYATYDNVSRVSWCPECNEANGELETRKIFEKLTGKIFLKTKGIFINKKLELDGYNDEIKIAFEHQGIQHYQYMPFFHRNGESDFHKQQERDQLKRDECLKLGIRLIEVHYTLDKSPNKELFICRKLEELGIISLNPI